MSSLLKLFLLTTYKKIIKKFSKGYRFSKIYPLNFILKNIESSLKSNFSEIQGSKMYLDDGDSLGLSIHGVYGEFDTEIIKKHLSPNDIVIDVGANIGYYTLLSAKLVGNSGKIYAFEPESTNFNLLKKNIDVNNYKNIIAENCAISDSNGQVSLFLAKSGIVGHRIYNSDKCSKSITVKKITLDEYFSKIDLIDKINFVKIDVEGYELAVLKGMRNILESSKHIKLFLEFNAPFITEAGFDPKELLNTLCSYNFQIYHLDYKKNILYKANLNDLLISNENNNLLCIK